MENREDIKKNIEQYIKLIQAVDPELYRIKMALLETNVNPSFIPDIIRSISLLAYGTAFGSIEIYMQKGEITMIKTLESSKVEKQAILIKEE